MGVDRVPQPPDPVGNVGLLGRTHGVEQAQTRQLPDKGGEVERRQVAVSDIESLERRKIKRGGADDLSERPIAGHVELNDPAAGHWLGRAIAAPGADARQAEDLEARAGNRPVERRPARLAHDVVAARQVETCQCPDEPGQCADRVGPNLPDLDPSQSLESGHDWDHPGREAPQKRERAGSAGAADRVSDGGDGGVEVAAALERKVVAACDGQEVAAVAAPGPDRDGGRAGGKDLDAQPRHQVPLAARLGHSVVGGRPPDQLDHSVEDLAGQSGHVGRAN